MYNVNESSGSENRLLVGLPTNAMILLVGVLGHYTYMAKVEYWGAQIEQKK